MRERFRHTEYSIPLPMRRPLTFFVWFIPVILVGSWVIFPSCSKPEYTIDLSPIGTLVDFELTDQNGNVFSKKSMAGKIWIVDFFFTRCPSICPLLTESMEKVAERWKSEKKVRFLSITVDAEYDQPQILKAFANEHALPQSRWTFLTGSPDAIHTLCEESFLLALGSAMKSNGEISHSSRLVLVDSQGQVRGYFDGLDEFEAPRLDQALQTLLLEK